MKKFMIIFASLMLIASLAFAADVQRLMTTDMGAMNFYGIKDQLGVPLADGCLIQIILDGGDGVMSPADVATGDPTGDDQLCLNNTFYLMAVNTGAWGFPGGLYWTAYFMFEDPIGSPPEPVANCGDNVYLRAWDGPTISVIPPYSSYCNTSVMQIGPPSGTGPGQMDWPLWDDTNWITLPVELSAFTATFMDGYTLIRWVTASETDVIGFNIYRGTEDEYSTSNQINIEYIPGHGTTTEPQYYEFQDIDQLIYETTYYYWLESVNYGGSSNVYGSIEYTPEDGTGGFEDDFDNNQLMNQPNPFSSTTTINYAIKGMLKSEPVNISIYNTLGQLILEDVAKNGVYQFDASDLPTGVYFYRLETESYNNIKKMMIIR